MNRTLRKKPETDVLSEHSKPKSPETGTLFSCSDFTALDHAQQAMYVRRLFQDGQIDRVKELVHNNERLRIAFYEASRVVVALWVGQGKLTFEKVSIGEEHTQGTVQRSSIFQFNSDQHVTQIQLAGFVMEYDMGIDHETSYTHASQEFDFLYDRQGFDYIYYEGFNPIGFNEKGKLTARAVHPPLNREEIMHTLQEIFMQEMQNVALILQENRDKLYTVACTLHEKGSLTQQEVQSHL